MVFKAQYIHGEYTDVVLSVASMLFNYLKNTDFNNNLKRKETKSLPLIKLIIFW